MISDLISDHCSAPLWSLKFPHERLLEGGAGVLIINLAPRAPLSRPTWGPDSSGPDFGVRRAKWDEWQSDRLQLLLSQPWNRLHCYLIFLSAPLYISYISQFPIRNPGKRYIYFQESKYNISKILSCAFKKLNPWEVTVVKSHVSISVG